MNLRKEGIFLAAACSGQFIVIRIILLNCFDTQGPFNAKIVSFIKL